MYGFSFQAKVVPQEEANAYERSLMGGRALLGFQYMPDTGRYGSNSVDA